jgi:hypothetical protein
LLCLCHKIEMRAEERDDADLNCDLVLFCRHSHGGVVFGLLSVVPLHKKVLASCVNIVEVDIEEPSSFQNVQEKNEGEKLAKGREKHA